MGVLERIIVDDARLILRHAWSVRLSALSAVLGLCSAAGEWLPYVAQMLPAKVSAGMAAAAALGGLLSRFVRQPRMRARRG